MLAIRDGAVVLGTLHFWRGKTIIALLYNKIILNLDRFQTRT